MWRYIYERQHAIDGSVKPWQLILHLYIALLVEIDDEGVSGGWVQNPSVQERTAEYTRRYFGGAHYRGVDLIQAYFLNFNRMS